MAFNRRMNIRVGTANPQTHPGFVVAFGSRHDHLDGEVERRAPAVEPDRSDRMVELNGVLWLLDAVNRGELTAKRMRDLLVQASRFTSDCCGLCDEILHKWPALDAEQREQRRQWELRAAAHPESHPYMLNANETKIHRWDCDTVAEAAPPVYADRHTYVMSAMHPYDFEDYEPRGARRITAAEATAWIANRRRPPR